MQILKNKINLPESIKKPLDVFGEIISFSVVEIPGILIVVSFIPFFAVMAWSSNALILSIVVPISFVGVAVGTFFAYRKKKADFEKIIGAAGSGVILIVFIMHFFVIGLKGVFLLTDKGTGNLVAITQEYPFFQDVQIDHKNSPTVFVQDTDHVQAEVDGYVYILEYTVSARIALSEENLGVINEYKRNYRQIVRSDAKPLMEEKLKTYIPKIDECSSPHFEITSFPFESSRVVLTGPGNRVIGSLEKKIKG